MADRRRFQTTTVEVEGREETKVVELPDRELEPWGDDADLHIVGQPVERVDAAQKVTGSATYTTDITLPGMLHAVLVRSTIARGRVTVDLDPVRQLPGVVDALSFDDLPPVAKPIRTGGVRFLDPDVSYVGQPVAVVCATSLVLAEAAAQALIVRSEPIAAAVTALQATADGAPPVRPHGNVSRSSPVRDSRGDADGVLAAAPVVVRGRYTTPSAIHSALEPHGAVAAWSGDQLTVHEGTQGVFKVRNDVAAALELPRGSVRVVMEHMGGGFGAKNYAGAHTLAAALLARRTGRPVRCVLDRRGEQSDTGHRPPAVIEVALGADRDGTLLAITAEAVVDQGVSGWESSTTKVFHELYACANVRTAETFVYTNTHAMAAFRGPGHTEGTFALERAMDELARALGMDPLELRLRNVPDHDQEKSRPYSAGTGALGRCLERAASRFGWEARSGQSKDPARVETVTSSGGDGDTFPAGGPPRYRRGRGIAAQVWPAGGGPPAYATVRIHPDGSIDVLTGTQDLGTGARTIFAQVAAEALGARLQDVRVILGDTERTPYTGNSWGSMTTPSVAPAVRMAAEDARDSLVQAASEILGAEPAAIRIVNGAICRPGDDPVPIAEVTRKLGQVTITGHGSRGPNPQGVALMTFGAQCAEVVVDTWTGRVRVERMIAVHDVGRVLNPRLARSQLEGGILQGLGFALFEERVLDERSGAHLNAGLHDYKIPTMADVPLIEATCLETVDVTANAVGARGLAEPPIIPTAAAVGNAVADALGVPVDDLPLSPWRVLEAIERGAVQS
jgi:xanthine dehydrogenase YagR molybdenum-binding subunit